MANIKDVAKKAGVSAATVSNVINESKFVAQETKNKVLESMKELNYYPNRAARTLRNKKSKTIGFVLPDISNFFFTKITKYLERSAKANDYSIILSSSDESLANEKEQVNILSSHQIDGLIIAPVKGDHSYLKVIQKEKKFPIIFIDRIPKGIEGVSILSDNVNGAYIAVSHLIKKGHKDIAIIAGIPDLTSTIERVEGYKKALAENSLKFDKKNVYYGDSRYQSGYELAKKIIKRNKVTAIFAANNLMTIGTMTYLVKHNIKIPSEIAVLSFDGFEWAAITSPPLTSVKQDSQLIAEKTLEKLLEQINSEDNEYQNRKSEVIKIPTKFIVRKST